MRLYAYIHAHSGAVRIVTRRILPSKSRRGPQWANDLLWELTAAQVRDILKEPLRRSNVVDLLRVAVRLRKHLNVPDSNRGRGHQSFVWSRGNWKLVGSINLENI